ncbi:endothelin-converting enzyme 2-like [Oratosquilla oratoria]|uniref:endothelin-converting enzyme 2-like n=1 Tax=Oratosquilla oratoria TaxID=337810 RepID=UPI003F76DA11
MALRVTKKVSLVLGVVLTLFIITIIILTIRPQKPSMKDQDDPRHGAVQGNVITESTTHPTTTTTTKKTTKKMVETTPSTTPTTTSPTTPAPVDTTTTTETTTKTTTTETATKTTTTEATTIVGARENTTATTTTRNTTEGTATEGTTTEGTATEGTTKEETMNTTETTVATSSPSSTTLATTDGDEKSTTVSSTEVDEITEEYTDNSTTTDTTPLTTQPTTLTTENATETTLSTTLLTTETTGTSTSTSTWRSMLPDHGANTCTTTPCKRLASRMLATMDHKTHPCTDFYQFACGGVLDDDFMDPIDPEKDVFRRVKEKLLIMKPEDTRTGPARVFFDSCVNYNMTFKNRLEAVSTLLEELGDFDTPADGKSTFDFTESLSHLLLNNFAPFFDVLLDVDDEDKGKFAFKLTLPVFPAALNLNIKEMTCRRIFEEKVAKALHEYQSIDINEEYGKYTQCIRTGKGLQALTAGLPEIVKQLNLTRDIEGDKEQTKTMTAAIQDIDFLYSDIYNAEKGIKNFPSEYFKDHYRKNYTVMTVQEVQDSSLGNVVEWKRLFEKLVGGDVDNDQKVQVYNFEDLKIVFEEIENKMDENEQVMENMLLLLWADRLYHDLVEEGSGTSSSSRTDFCVHVTMRLLHDLSAAIYIHSFEDSYLARAQGEIKRIVEDTKKTLEVQMTENKGVPEEFKQKLVYMNFNVGNPNVDGSAGDGDAKQELEKSMEGYTMEPNQFLKNTVTLMKRFRANMYSLFHNGTTSPEAMWNQYVLPQSTSCVYLYALNHFVIPYGAMNLPFYKKGYPDVINSAGIGLMISHEMMHAFDSTGLKYDGNRRYTRDELPELPMATAVSECLNEQLQHNFSLPTKSGTTNTVQFPHNLPLNELMADSAALRLAWSTYNKKHPVKDTHALLDPEVPEHITPSRPSDELLPWLGLNHEQLFYLRLTQNQCEEPRTLLAIMERPHIPASVKINMLLRNDPYFSEAFQCSINPRMTPEPCIYTFEKYTDLEH